MFELKKYEDKYYLIGKNFKKIIDNQFLFDLFKKIYLIEVKKNNEKFLENFESFYFDDLSDFIFIDDVILKKLYNNLFKYYLKEKIKCQFLYKNNDKIYSIPLYKEEIALKQLIKLLNKLNINL